VKTAILNRLVLFIISTCIPYAAWAETDTTQSSISQLLEKVKESKGDERRKAMNTLKLKLRTVNAATRAKTMQELHRTFAGAHSQHRTGVHGTQQIPHQQIQQKTNRQQQMNIPHHSKHKQRPLNHQPHTPRQIPSGGHP